jgi:chromosome partitioning protein
MPIIAVFNNKGGVGKTTLIYHLSHMFAKLSYRTLVVDLDPQANLTAAFFDEDRLEELSESEKTINACLSPVSEGLGDISNAHVEKIKASLFIIPGDLRLSKYEDMLAQAWLNRSGSNNESLRKNSSIYRIIKAAEKLNPVDLILLDVGPNLGALNRVSLLSADFLLVPMEADLFSIQGIQNLGPTIKGWKEDWEEVLQKRRKMTPLAEESILLPAGKIEPIGYTVLQHIEKLSRPTRQYAKWIDRIPKSYRNYLLQSESQVVEYGQDPHRLSAIRNYYSLMPMSQDARKPIFDLKSADGAIGSHQKLVQECYTTFEALAHKIIEKCGIVRSTDSVP